MNINDIVDNFLTEDIINPARKLNAFQLKMRSIAIKRGKRIENNNAIKNAKEKMKEQ